MKLFLHTNDIEKFIANGILLSSDIGDCAFWKQYHDWGDFTIYGILESIVQANMLDVIQDLWCFRNYGILKPIVQASIYGCNAF